MAGKYALALLFLVTRPLPSVSEHKKKTTKKALKKASQAIHEDSMGQQHRLVNRLSRTSLPRKSSGSRRSSIYIETLSDGMITPMSPGTISPISSSSSLSSASSRSWRRPKSWFSSRSSSALVSGMTTPATSIGEDVLKVEDLEAAIITAIANSPELLGPDEALTPSPISTEDLASVPHMAIESESAQAEPIEDSLVIILITFQYLYQFLLSVWPSFLTLVSMLPHALCALTTILIDIKRIANRARHILQYGFDGKHDSDDLAASMFIILSATVTMIYGLYGLVCLLEFLVTRCSYVILAGVGFVALYTTRSLHL